MRRVNARPSPNRFSQRAILWKNESLAPLTRDIVANRETSSAIISLLAEWQLTHLDADGVDQSRILPSITFAMGGAYERVYLALTQHADVDIASLLSSTIRSYIVELGIDPATFDLDKNSFMLDESFLAEANAYVLEHLND